MNSIIIQTFLFVLVIGGFIFLVILIFRGLFSPRKLATLKNYIKEENYKTAITLAKSIINKDNSNTEAHYLLGVAYYNLGKNELALIEFKNAEKTGYYTKISERELREKLAELYFKMNDIEEALKEYIILSKQYQNDYIYSFKIGELFEKKDLKQQALKYYSDTLKINGNYIPALMNVGILLYETKNFSEAEKFLQRVANKEPNNSKAHFYLGILKKTESNYKAALKFFEKSMKDKEYKVRSLTERGAILMLQNNLEEAVIELDRALKNCETEDNIKMNIRYILADCYEKMRNITEAIILWEQIYAVRPDFRNVAEKLTNYQELRLDDRMKDFLTAKEEEFYDICKGIVLNMGLNVIEQTIISKDAIQFLCLEPDSKWRNIKKRPKLLYISRRSSPIDESVIRDVHETMREKAIIRGIIITSSVFTKLARVFTKERPIELIDKEGLKDILKHVNV